MAPSPRGQGRKPATSVFRRRCLREVVKGSDQQIECEIDIMATVHGKIEEGRGRIGEDIDAVEAGGSKRTP